MKKLRVFLLAIAFVFSLAAQASAVVEQVGEEAFADVETITFDDVSDGEEILSKYWSSYGVNFSQSVYGDNLSVVSLLYFGSPIVGNLYVPDIQSQMVGDPPFEPVITLNFRERLTGVGFWVYPISGSVITVVVLRDGAVTFEFTHNTALLGYFIGIEDLEEGIDSIEVSADGQFAIFESVLFMNDLKLGDPLDTGPTEVEVTMNVRPPNCLGTSINVKSKGVIPVVIAGKDVDVTMIDPTTILLNGVAPVRSALEDVPYCGNGPDGDLELTLKFDTQELVDAMEASALAAGETLENYDLPVLHLTGSLFDGTAIYADEPVNITGKPAKENQSKGKKRSFKSHSRHDRGHHKGWDKHR